MKPEVYFCFPILFVVYLIVAYIRLGTTRSISATYTHLKRWQQIIPILVLLLGVAIPIAAIGFQLATGHTVLRWLWIVSAVLITMVGSAPVITGKLSSRIHIGGAIGGIATSMLAIALTLPGWCNIVMPVVFAVFVGVQEIKKLNIKIPNNTYWTEVIAVAITWGCLFVYYKSL